MGTSYEKRKAERDAIARAFIAELRANGYDDDAIVKALIQHNLVELDLSDGIAKALGTPQRYGYPVGPALTLAAEEVAKGTGTRPIPRHLDRIKKAREAGEDLSAGDGGDLTHINRQVQVAKSRGSERAPVSNDHDMTDRIRKAAADRKAERAAE